MKKTRLIAVVLSLCMLLALIPVAALAVDFTDIADATNGSYVNAIERWSDEGVISGVGNDAFNPKGNMTRVQGFGIIANLLNLTEKADLSEYTDVPTATWKVDYLAKVVAAGIVTGYPNKALGPDDDLTREQMFVTIARTLGIQPVATDDEAFKDIGKAGDYAVPYINALHKIGAVNGYNGNVNPLDTLSREGAALLLDNLIGGYANADGETAVIVAGKITLIVADNAKVEGTANELPIVIAGQAHIVDMRGVKGAATVIVTVPGVEIRNAPVGTKVTVPEGITGVRVNGRAVAGGQTIIVEGTSGGGSGTITPTKTSYEIVYSDGKNTYTDYSESNTSEVKSFTALTEEQAKKQDLLTSVAANMKFVSWATADGTAYEPGAKYDISGKLELTAQFIDTSDYIALAVKGTMDKINNQVIAVIDAEDDGIGTRGSSVKIDRLAYNGVTDDNNARTQTVSGSVTASADLANYIVEYACTVATTLLSNPNATPDKSDVEKVVRSVVEQLEDTLGIQIMRSDGIKKTAEKIFNAVKNHVDPAGAFRNMDNGNYCFKDMTVSINGVKEAVVNVMNNQATLSLPDGKTRSEVISNVALAVAKDLYKDLKTKTDPANKLELNATVDVKFTAADSVDSKNPTKYPVTVKLTLNAGTLGEVWYNPNAETVNEQPGAIVVKVNASEIEGTYDREVKEVINEAIEEMDDSFNDKLEGLVENGGAMEQLAKAVEEFGVASSGQGGTYVKNILSQWLQANLDGGLESKLAKNDPVNSLIYNLVDTLSTKASETVKSKLNEKIVEVKASVSAPSAVDAIVEAVIGATDFVPVKSDGNLSGGQYGVEELADTLADMLSSFSTSPTESFELNLDQLKGLDSDLKLYIYSVITDELKKDYNALVQPNYKAQNASALTTGVDNMIKTQLNDMGTEELFDTLGKVSTLDGLAGLTLKEIKTLVNDPNVKDVVGGLGLTDSLKGYINKIPTDRLPDEATVTFHISGEKYELSKEDLANFKRDATSKGLATALANLATPNREKLSLSVFDVDDVDNPGVRVDVEYNTRAFTFYLWIDGLK